MNLTTVANTLIITLICLSAPVLADEITVNAVGDAMLAGRWAAGTAPGFKKIFVEDISRARQQADYVIVSFHGARKAHLKSSPTSARLPIRPLMPAQT